jgi:Tol biopolymer transport system component/tRNA A-37 threonylcarbamoyl transferase component Bud32
VTDATGRLTAALADRYRLERELGQGGMATVYLAEDLKHDRRVAVKVLRPELAAVLGAERFVQEIKTTAALQHPHILPLFDSGTADGFLFYVMPYVEGETLRTRLEREGQLGIAEAVRITTDVADALDYAHRRGVVHRDIKPENILLHDGQVLVSDFGIALALSTAGGERMTESGISLGTPPYMSPEQASGDRRIDGRTDVYSLGCVLYEMLSGEPPYTGPTAQAIVARVLTEPVPSLRSRRDTVSPELEDAILGAVRRLPADRFATPRAFAEALVQATDAAAPGQGAVVRAAGPRLQRGGWRREVRRPLTVALAAAIVVLAAALVLTLVLRSRGPAGSTGGEAVIRFRVAVPPDLSNLGEPLLGAANVALSPDGRTIAFLADDATGVRRVYLRALDDPTPRALPGTEAAYEPCFSPDGRWIAFWAAGKVQRVALAGGMPLPVGETSQVFGLAWPRADLIVAVREREFSGISPDGGPWRPIAPVDTAHGEQQQLNGVPLPGGDDLLYASAGASGMSGIRMAVVSLRSGTSTLFDVTGAYPLGVLDGQLIYVNQAGTIMAVPFDLAAKRVTGSPVQLLTGLLTGSSGTAQTAALSPTGTLAYVVGSPGSVLVSVDLHGRLTTVEPGVQAYGYPRYSPDGRRIAYSVASGGRTDVWIYDLASRTPTRLTTAGLVNERPEWTPDGKRVLFRSDEGTVRSNIWWAPADLSAPPAHLLGTPREYVFEAVMTPDAKRVVYQVDTMGADIFYRSLTGDTTPKPVAASRAIENMARVSPDGRWVAYTTDESGPYQVVVQPFPGPGPRVQVSVGGGTEPVWAPDGRHLFYRGSGKFFVAQLNTAPGLTVTSRTALFADDFEPAQSPHANYDVAPDGKHLLLLKSSRTPELMLVYHWDQVLRARLGGGR